MKFYDTCSLLLKSENIFDDGRFAISTITINELERIKTSANKDVDTKIQAERVIRQLEQRPNDYDVVIFNMNMLAPIKEKHFDITDDLKILASAIWYDTNKHPDDTIFVTNDLSLKNIANLFFGSDSIESVVPEEDDYCGYKIVTMDEQEMEFFYSNPGRNDYELYINQYLVIRDANNQIVDRLCWLGDGYRKVSFDKIETKMFGTIKPYGGDIYQQLLFDCLQHNELTVIRGVPGSGKSMIALGYLMHLLEKNIIDNIVIFCNTVATKDSAKLGYYPGDKNTKLLDSQIGNFLATKLGDIHEVERMIDSHKLTLVPISDCRGMSIKANTGVYMTEAQNTNSDIMKLVLQRIEAGCVCIIEGDDKTQVDMMNYENNNGLKKMSKIFRGQPYYGEVTLKKCHRSKIAERAELM